MAKPHWPQLPVVVCVVALLAPYLTAYPVDIRTSGSKDQAIKSSEENSLTDNDFPNDHLTPYLIGRHGSKRTTRDVENCKHVSWQNETFEVFPYKPLFPQPYEKLYELHRFADTSSDGYYSKQYMLGTIAYINNPFYSLSVLEPGKTGGCAMDYFTATRSTVEDTASSRKYGCKLSANAGYFDTITGKCYGNVVSDSRIVQTANNDQNANFGIREDGSIVVGYIPDEEVANETNPFRQLVSGVIWLVRNGTNFVNASKQVECSSHEETGNMETFVNVISARSAIGHDARGRVVLARVDGQTHHRGSNLYEFADLLIKHGVVNAINLDGGGSNTLVQDGVLVSFPSDHCNFQPEYRCARAVSTVLCVHDPECIEPDCSNHGSCDLGVCSCDPPWIGEGCGRLNCSLTNCSSHGACNSDKGSCECVAGWNGDECEQKCDQDHYGEGCKQRCWCAWNQLCHAERGCVCKPGYSGNYWCSECEEGFYGVDCAERCPDPFCSGNGRCSKTNGSCVCFEGWTGLSCGSSSSSLTDTTGTGGSGSTEGEGSGERLSSSALIEEAAASGIEGPDASSEPPSTATTPPDVATPPSSGSAHTSSGAAHTGSTQEEGTASTVSNVTPNNRVEVTNTTLTATVFISLLTALVTLIVHALFCFLTRKWAYRAAVRDTLGLPRKTSLIPRPPRKRRRRRRRKGRKGGPMEPILQQQSSSDCSI